MTEERKPEHASASGLSPARIGSRPILDSLLEGCQIIGFDWTYLYLNDAAAAHGRRSREELLGRTMMEAYPGIEETPLFERLRDCMENRTPHQLDNEFTYPDGSTGWFELRIEPVPEGVFVLSLDVGERVRAAKERRRLEEQYRQAQKMEAVGRLAGGLAHDFNNLLSVVLACSELALDGLRPRNPVRTDLEEIRRAAESAAGLTRRLLAVGRRQVLAPRVIYLNEVVGRMEEMLGRLLGSDIHVSVRLAPDLGKVRADPGQIEQVLMNLVVNARDAMPRGGRLSIETSNVELDEVYCEKHAEVEPGPYVLLAVGVTGEGRDGRFRAGRFEPFFTTKGPGEGTGLGLATVYGIVQQSRGSIWVYSEPGEGTTFRIYLPREFEAPAEAAPPERVAPPAPGGGETVLLVEDQEAVRGLIARILDRAGYTVLPATDGEDALRACEEWDGEVHLVLSDMVMPGMSGRELVGRLQEAHPELRVLFMSGYTEDAVRRDGVLASGTDFIPKPFTATELAARVRAALAG